MELRFVNCGLEHFSSVAADLTRVKKRGQGTELIRDSQLYRLKFLRKLRRVSAGAAVVNDYYYDVLIGQMLI